MIKTLLNKSNNNTSSNFRMSSLLTPLFIIILYLGDVSNVNASNFDGNNDIANEVLEDFANTPKIIKSYKITDASTEGKSCFPTKGVGVIFQRGLGGNCGGLHHIWRVKDELIFNEYDDDTATIKGSVIDDDGKTGIVNIKLSNKVQTGNTWPAQCYENGISDPRELYRDFNGNITINGISFTVNPISSGQHYIVADGAGFEPGEFGFGGWTGGSFGSCTEWFGKLEEIEIRCDVTANAGIDVSIAFGDSTTLTATGGGNYIWSTGETTASITVEPTATTTYSVMVTSTNGDCTDADQVIVTVDCVMEVDLGDDLQLCDEDEIILTANITNIPTYTKIISAYNITDADTSTGICANVHGNEQGVILQKNNPNFPISGKYNAWKVYNGLILNEYDNQTAKITGSVIDENGNIGIVDVLLFDKQNQGQSWSNSCYLNGLVGPQLFYQSFHGTITVNGVEYTVEPNKGGNHFILAEGASLEPNQFGFGAWTAGTFGNGGEWFGNLEPIKIENCEAVTYLWSTGETSESITVTESGEYTLTVKTCVGCEVTDTVKVDFNKVKANAGDDETICYGDTTTLTATGGGTYLWSTGETTASITVNPTSNTTYTVTVTSDEGCKATDEVTVSVNPEVIANAGADVAICKGEEVILTATGGGFYLWSTGETTASITVNPTADTTYSVTVTSNEDCEATDEVTVSVNPEVTANAGADVTICKGEEVTLTATGGGFYLWSTGETTASISVSPTADTTYSVTVTSNEDCEATDEVTVSVNPEVTANAGADVTICKGEEVTLTATGGGFYLWSTGETTASISVSPTTDTTYAVTVTSDEDCEATDEVTVSVNPEVTANAGADVAICKGEEVTLTATGGGFYLWSTGETTASISVSPTADTTYSVTVTSNEDCEATDEVTVSVNPEVTANAGADVTICKGEEVTLTATGGGFYLWSTGETTASITVNPTTDTTYAVTVTSNEDCEATDEVTVSVNPEVIANAGDDVEICEGDEVILTATGGGTYLWSTGETTATISVTPTTNMTYTVTVTSAEGCEATDTVYVTVAQKITIGDFVWLDENENGIQDDGATGINDVKVTLYECNGTEVASTITDDNAAGEAGAYSFEVCPDSGYYYVVFDDVPELLEFTSTDSGDDAQDSDANENGRTQCFNVTNVDILTIDAGLVERCDIKIDAGDDGEICEIEIVELTANILDDTADCPGGCVYPVKEQDRCYGPTGDFEVYLVSTGSVENFKFKALRQKFERLDDNSVRYTATASNGKDIIEVDAMFTGYTQIAPINSPKANSCQQYDTSDWEYWTTWSGTITSRDHGVFNLSVKGAAFQMGIGADVVRTGFGASGWFYVEGGDGFYTEGDVNVALDECVEDNVSYQWTTEDGNIVGSSNQKTIRVDQPGTYTVEAINCIDCVTTDTVKLLKGNCNLSMNKSNPMMSTVFPVPVKSGGTLTIEFDTNNNLSASDEEFKVVPLKAGVDHVQRKEDVSVVLYNVLGQMISTPRSFKIENGKATIYLDLDYIPTGKYILRAQGPTWSDAKNIIVE